MIEIDGSYREGGGQILRTASLLSCATGKGIHIYNIRKGRSNPGLRHQHLWGLTTLGDLCNAEIKGAELGSMEVWFSPKSSGVQYIEPLQVKIPTAGSITLVLQSLIIPASLFKNRVNIVFDGGATDTSFSPTINYYLYVLLPMIRRIGYRVEIEIKRRGYYPKGGAKLEATVYPNENPRCLELTNQGRLRRISIFSYASEFLERKRVAERQAEAAGRVLNYGRKILRFAQNEIFEKEIKYFETFCPGSSIDVIAEYENTVLGANALGEIGKTSEKVGEEAAQILLEDIRSEGCLDRYMADQILPYVALGKGLINQIPSEFSVARVGEHCLTNMWVIEKFFGGKFWVEGNTIKWKGE